MVSILVADEGYLRNADDAEFDLHHFIIFV